MAHTPGPWRIGNAGTAVFGPPNGNPSPETIASELTRGNAKLISAAPELLDLAKLHANQCAEWAARIRGMGEVVEAEAYAQDEWETQALIAKAEGK